MAIVGLGAVLRIAWAVAKATEPTGPELHDPVLYLILGDQVANGQGYSYPGDAGGVTAYYPPGYPMFLAALMWGIGLLPGDVSPYGIALWANVALSIATIPLVFALGRRLGSPVVGLAAAAAFAFWPNLVFHSGVLLTETLFLFLLAVLFLVAFAAPEVARSPGRWRLVSVGLLLGIAGLVRPVSLVIAPLFILLWWSSGVKRAVQYTAIVGVATVAVIVPWTVRNIVQMDSPVLISANFGDNFCVGNNPDATGAYGLPPYCFDGLDAGERPEFETHRQSVTMERGMTWLKDHPLDAIISAGSTGAFVTAAQMFMRRLTNVLWLPVDPRADPLREDSQQLGERIIHRDQRIAPAVEQLIVPPLVLVEVPPGRGHDAEQHEAVLLRLGRLEPDWIAPRVDLPIAPSGRARSRSA